MVTPDRLARARLTCLAEPGDTLLSALIGRHGPADAVAAIVRGKLPADLGDLSGGPARKALDRWRSRLADMPGEDQVQDWLQAGIRLICPGDREWPEQLDDLGGVKPYALWARGSADLRFNTVRSLSVTGSRAATAYGSHVASAMAGSVAVEGWTVVSGAAYGVDGAAHSAALGADGLTVAVLASGVDVPYPAGHEDLLDMVAARGVVASEWPPGRNPSRLRFLARNRIIAALSPATLVIEAGERSGTLNTARHARALGRTLMAVPGPVTSEQSRGCHALIRDWGATLVTTPADVLDAMPPPGTRQG